MGIIFAGISSRVAVSEKEWLKAKGERKEPVVSAGPAEPAEQLEFGFELNQSEAGKSAIDSVPSVAELRKRAFDRFRFSMPKEVARIVEPFSQSPLQFAPPAAAGPRSGANGREFAGVGLWTGLKSPS